MEIFEYLDYRLFLKDFISGQEIKSPKYRARMLEGVRMSSSLFSQIIKSEKNLSAEHALEICLFFGLSERETDYFLLLNEYSKAGSEVLKARILKKIRVLQNQALSVAAKVPHDVTLTELEKATYYSSWLYTAVRNLIPTRNGMDIRTVSEILNIPFDKVDDALKFLISIKLVEVKNGKYFYRQGFTHLDSDHPLIFRHHQNWRQRAIVKMDHYRHPNLHYTSPMSLSKSAAEKIQTILREGIKESIATAQSESPEVAYCLNIDWFEF